MSELFSHLHHAKRFAVTLRIRRAELPLYPLLQCAALQISNHRYGPPVEARHAAGHGRVVAKRTVTVDLAEISKQRLHEIHRVWTLRVPRKLRLSPCFWSGRCGGV